MTIPTGPVHEYGPLRVATLSNGPLQENAVLVWDAATLEGYLIDPGDEAPRLLQWVRSLNVKVRAIVLTHGHFDHIGAVEAARRELAVDVHLHAGDLPLYRLGGESAARYGLPFTQPADPDHALTQGQTLALGSSLLTVRELPGHAPGHIVLTAPGFVIAGDTLFESGVGRSDLPGGNHQQLIDGIQKELLTLADDTVVYPGHGRPTTVGRERATNPYL